MRDEIEEPRATEGDASGEREGDIGLQNETSGVMVFVQMRPSFSSRGSPAERTQPLCQSSHGRSATERDQYRVRVRAASVSHPPAY